jgi:hypothetical protein
MIRPSSELGLDLGQDNIALLLCFLTHCSGIILLGDFKAFFFQTVLSELVLVEIMGITASWVCLFVVLFYAIKSDVLSCIWLLGVLA